MSEKLIVSELVAVQPVGKYENFESSVKNDVNNIYAQLSSETKAMLGENLGRPFYGVNKDVQYKKMDKGTLVLFSYESKIVMSAQVVGLIESSELSELAWGDSSYRYIYFLNEIHDQDFKTVDLYKAVYGSESHFRGFTVLDEENSRKADSYLNSWVSFIIWDSGLEIKMLEANP